MRVALVVLALLAACGLAACDTASGPDAPLALRWQLDNSLAGAPQAVPLVVGDSLIVYAAGVDLVCVRLTTGAVKWRTRVSEAYTLQTRSLVTDGDRVYTSQHVLGDKSLRAYSLTTGRELWRRTAGDAEFEDVSPFAKYAASGGVFFASNSDGQVLALDGATGATRWRVQLDSASVDAMTYADGVVYAARGRVHTRSIGFVTAYDAATGRELWSFFRPAPFWGVPPVIDGSDVLALADSVYRLDRQTGRRLWAAPIPPGTESEFGADQWLEDDGRYLYGSDVTPWKVEKATGRFAWRSPDFVGGGGYNVVELGGRVYHARGDVEVLDGGTGRSVHSEPTPGYTWWVAEGGGLVLAQQEGSLLAFEPARPASDP